MSFWTPNSMRAACAGRFLARPKRLVNDEIVSGVSIDTRTLKSGEAFIALEGERFDGHDFLTDAIAAQASMLIISDESRLPVGLPERLCVIRVGDTRRALVRLAAAYRKTFEGVRIIAVTGSNGKTTTCRLVDAALSTRLQGVVSEKSFNNDIGVPLTILRIRRGDQYLICEVGANDRGEIPALARVIEPDVAVVTSIGRAHLEGFGSVDAIIREKAALISYLRPGGVAVGPVGVPLLENYLRTAPNAITFGRSEAADLRPTDIEHVEDVDGRHGLRFRVNGRDEFRIPLLGEHNAYNALAAIAVARRLGLDHGTIAAGLQAAQAPEMRLAIRNVNGFRIVNDAYNANPESTDAALSTFLSVAARAERRVVVLGDMLELGDDGPALHAEIGRRLAEPGAVDLLIAIGPLALHAAERYERTRGGENLIILDSLDGGRLERVTGALRQGDAILLKGSRGMRLERIERALAKDLVESEPESGGATAGAAVDHS